MTHKIKTYLMSGALTVSLGFVGLSPALANPATDSVERFFAWAKETGAVTAEYGSLVETGPEDAILRDAKLAWSFSFKFGSDELTVDLAMDAPEIRFFGAKQSDSGVFFQKVEQPGVFEFRASATEKASDEGDDKTLFAMTGRQHDAVTTGYFQPTLPVVAEAPEQPVSRFFPLLRTALDTRIEASSARLIEAETRLADGSIQTDRYEGLAIKGMQDGRIAEQRIERMVSESTLDMTPDDDTDKPVTMRQESGVYLVLGQDLKPVLRLVGVLPADTKVRATIMERTELNDLTVSTPFGSFSLKKASADNAHIVPETPVFPIGQLADQAVLGTLPEDRAAVLELGRKALTTLEGLSIAELELDALAIKSEEVNGGIDRVAVKNASYRNLGDLTIKGTSFKIRENDTDFALARFQMSDFALSPLASYLGFMVLADEKEPSLTEYLSMVPTLGLIDIQGLKVASNKLPTPISLTHYRFAMSDFIAPFPTRIGGETKGLEIPVRALDNKDARRIFGRLGLESLRYSDEIKLVWDEDDQTLSLDPMKIAIDGGGTVELAFELGGIPRIVFEDPEQAQAAMATATVNRLQLAITDARLVTSILDSVNGNKGDTPEDLTATSEEFAQMLADEAMTNLGPVKDTAFGQNLHAAIKTFLVSPGRFELHVEPNAPVPATQILGMLATSPQMLPGLLNASVSAAP